MKRRHRCTYCGKLDHGLELHHDAADSRHWFHPVCWERFRAWLNCETVTERTLRARARRRATR